MATAKGIASTSDFTGMAIKVDQLIDSAGVAVNVSEISPSTGVTAGTVAASKPVVVDANKDIGSFRNVTATTFIGAVTGNVTGNVAGTVTLTGGTVAAAGTDNTNATAVTAQYTKVTAGDGTKGVILPVPAIGVVYAIKNNSASVLKVYPGTSAAINALTATTGAISMAANTFALFVGDSATQWFTLPLLPS